MATKKTTAYGVYSGDDLSQFFGGGTSSTKKKEQNNGLLTNEVMQDYLDNKNKQRESFERGRQLVEAQRARDAQAEAKNAHTASELDLAHGILPATSNAQAFANQHGRSSLDDAVDQIAGNNVLSQQGKVNRIGEEVQNRFGNQTEPVINNQYDLSRAIRSEVSQNRQTNTAINNALNRYQEEQERKKQAEDIGSQRNVGALTRELNRKKQENSQKAWELSLEMQNAGSVERVNEIQKQIDALNESTNRTQQQLDNAIAAQDYLIRYNSDFADNAQYDESILGSLPKFTNGNNTASLYQFINGRYQPKDAGDPTAESWHIYTYLDDKERGTYNYLLKTEGAERADEYLRRLQPELEARNAQAISARAYEYGQRNPWKAAAGTVAFSPLRTLGALGTAYDEIVNGKVNENAWYNTQSQVLGSARSGALDTFGESVTNSGVVQGIANSRPVSYFAERVLDQSPKEVAENVGKVAKFLGSGTLSHLDSLWNGFLMQNISALQGGMNWGDAQKIYQLEKDNPGLISSINPEAANRAKKIVTGAEELTRAVMGAEVVSDAVREAKQRGLSDEQAFELGMVAGAAEYITEKWSIGDLFESDWTKPTLTKMLTHGGGEFSEELMSSLINEIADISVAGEKSQFRQDFNEYKKNGASDGKAFAHTLLDHALESGKEGLSAFLTTGVSVGLTSVQQNIHNPQTIHNKVSSADSKNGGNVGATVDGMLADLINRPETEWASGLADIANQFRGTVRGNTMNAVRDYIRETARNQADAVDKGAYTAIADYLTPYTDQNGKKVDNRNAVWKLAEERNGTAKQTAHTETAPEQTLPSTAEAAPSTESTTPSIESSTAPSTPSTESTTPQIQATNAENQAITAENQATTQQTAQNVSQTSENAPAAENAVETENNTVAENEAQKGSTEARDDGRSMFLRALNVSEEATDAEIARSLLNSVDRRKFSNRFTGLKNTAASNMSDTLNDMRQSGQYTPEQIEAARQTAVAVDRELLNMTSEAGVQKLVNAGNAALKKAGIKAKIVVDNVAARDYKGDVVARGSYKDSDGTIHISPYLDTNEAIYGVIAHEMFHKAADGSERAQLVDDILAARSAILDASDSRRYGISRATRSVIGNASMGDFVESYGDLLMKDFGLTEEGQTALQNKLNANPGMDTDTALKQLCDENEEAFWQMFMDSDSLGTAQNYMKEEVAAHFFEELGSQHGEAIMRELMRNDRNLFERIIDAVRRYFHRNDPDYARNETYNRIMNAYERIAAEEAGTEARRLKGTVAQKAEMSESAIMTDGNGNEIDRYSIDSFVEPLGLKFQKGENGITQLLDNNNKPVTKVTAQDIMDSDYGALIQNSIMDGVITKEQGKQEAQFLADTMQMMLDTQDIDLIWAVNSTIGFQPIASGVRGEETFDPRTGKFAAFTSNSDPQYGTTVDFTTICKKTQAVIDAMSEVMKREKHGLTQEEIVNIVYDEVAKSGEPVPCPVCYVFARWVGLGGLFDSMYQMQQQYPIGMDETKIRDDIAELGREIEKMSGSSFGKQKNELYKQLVNEQKDLEKKRVDAETRGTEPLTAEEQKRLDKINQQIQYIDQWTWLTTVRLQPDYAKNGYVDPDVLFDINAGKRFAEESPKAWAYRTSRGPAMGKAATPYAAEHLGQIITGLATPSTVSKHTLGNLANDKFLGTGGTLDKSASRKLTDARRNARRQNLLNGQRLQSTSDFRYEYALDYLMALFELQSVGAKAQMYTKVPEMVSMAASCGVEVNLSLMPLGDGYGDEGYTILDKDGNPILDKNGDPIVSYLTFSDVTGINAEDAFRYSSMYDNVQPIMVGINHKHIRMCMEDPRITFIIPYHASGANESRYVAMMQSVGEAVKDRVDYSAYQTDSKNKNATEEQKAAYSARKKILTGKASAMTDAERTAVRNNEILSQLHIRFYGQDIDGNEAKADPRYLNVADRESGRDSETYQTFLKPGQADIIMPHEFWDRNVTIDNAAENGRRFVEYCESLGLHPRFSGWNSDGNYNADYDFTNEDGYWKTIPDRKMYNVDGTYHEQKPVNISNFQTDYLLETKADPDIVKRSASNNPAKTAEIADRSIARIREGRGEAVRQSRDVTSEVPDRAYNIPDGYGIFIRNTNAKYVDNIFSGKKTIETRNDRTLDSAIGKWTPIINTEKKQVVGEAFIDHVIEYENVDDYKADRDKHLVPEGSKFYWDGKGHKYGYVITDTRKYDTPRPLDPNANRYGRIAADVSQNENSATRQSRLVTPETDEEYMEAARNADNAIEFWMNLSEEQQKQVGENYKNLYETLKKSAGEKPEWVTPRGNKTDMSVALNKPDKDLEVKVANYSDKTKTADADADGVITLNKANADTWSDYVFMHEIGHQIASLGILDNVISNPGGLFGRYNQKHNLFEDTLGFAQKNPDEAFSDAYAYYRLYPETLKERSPDVYAYFEKLTSENPWVNNWADKAFDKCVQIARENNVDIRYSRAVTPEMDAEYMEAVESGDTEKQQRMVDDAAKEAGYKKALFHGTGEYFNIFRRGYEGIHLGNLDQAQQVANLRFENNTKYSYYDVDDIIDNITKLDAEGRQLIVDQVENLSAYYDIDDVPPFDGDINNAEEVSSYVKKYAEKVRPQTKRGTFSMRSRTFDRKTGKNIMSLYAKINNPLVINGDIGEWSVENIARLLNAKANGKVYKTWTDREIDTSDIDLILNDSEIHELEEATGDAAWDKLADVLSEHGYDGIQYLNQFEGDKNSYSYIALHPSDVKSANPVTYDNDGNPIPLSERFNPENEDIRYSREVSTKQDQEYMDAVESGDEETAYRMIDEAAKAKGLTIFDDEYPTIQSLYEGVKNGELLIHARRLDPSEISDYQYGLEPTWGDTMQGTEAAGWYDEEGIEPPELIFASDGTTWSGDERNGIIFVRSDDFQQSNGDGTVNLPDGSTVPYERSPVADYEDPALREEPAGVESGDWYTNKVEDVVAVMPFYAKSGDITYDDSGNVIPLSQRFNPESEDFRESRMLKSESDYEQALAEEREKRDFLTKQFVGKNSFGYAKALDKPKHDAIVKRYTDLFGEDIPADEINKVIREFERIMERPKRDANDTAEARMEEAWSYLEQQVRGWVERTSYENVLKETIGDEGTLEGLVALRTALRDPDDPGYYYIKPDMVTAAGSNDAWNETRRQLNGVKLKGFATQAEAEASGRKPISELFTKLISDGGAYNDLFTPDETASDYEKLSQIANMYSLSKETESPYERRALGEYDNSGEVNALVNDIMYAWEEAAEITKMGKAAQAADAQIAKANQQTAEAQKALKDNDLAARMAEGRAVAQERRRGDQRVQAERAKADERVAKEQQKTEKVDRKLLATQMAAGREQAEQRRRAQEREAAMKKRFDESYDRLRRSYDRKLDRASERYDKLQNRIKGKDIKRAQRMVLGRIAKDISALDKLQNHPSKEKNKYIPQRLLGTVAKVREAVQNFANRSGKTIDPARLTELQQSAMDETQNFMEGLGQGLKGVGSATEANARQDPNITDVFIRQADNLIQQLRDLRADIEENHPARPTVDENGKRITPTSEMIAEDNAREEAMYEYFNTVRQLLDMTLQAIRNEGKMILNGRTQDLREVSQLLASDLKQHRQKDVSLRHRNLGDETENWFQMGTFGLMSADAALQRLGDNWHSFIARSIREGQNRQMKHQADFSDFMRETIGDYDITKGGFYGDYVQLERPDGTKFNVTRHELMSLYALWNRPAGRLHLENGGGTFINQNGQAFHDNNVVLTDELVKEYTDHLTDQEKEIVDKVVDYMSHKASRWGNDVSMYVYGYRLFNEDSYFPMEVADYANKRSFADPTMPGSGLNPGFTQALTRSKKPLAIRDFFDVVNDHILGMANYNAYGAAAHDLDRILNSSLKDGDKETSMIELLRKTYGNGAVAYLKEFVQKLAGTKQETKSWLNNWRTIGYLAGNLYKRAAVSWNLSTAAKQPLSIIRAANEIDPKYLIFRKPLSPAEYRAAKEKMESLSGIAKIKSLGYSDTGHAKSLQATYDDKYFSDSNFIRRGLGSNKAARGAFRFSDKFTEAGMYLAGKADEMTWVNIWDAVTREVKDKYPNLAGDDLDAKITERFNEVIGLTQVVDSVLDSAPILQEKIFSIAFPFMNEPVKSASNLILAASKVKQPGGKQKFVKAAGLQLLSAVLLEPLVTTLASMWRDEKDDIGNGFWNHFLEKMFGIKKDEDDDGKSDTDWKSITTSNAFAGIWSMPFITQLYDVYSNALQDYDNTSIDRAAVVDLVKAFQNLHKYNGASNGNSAKTQNRLWREFAESFASVLGVPAKTIRRQISGTARMIMNATDADELKWEYNKLSYNLENSNARSQKGFYDILAHAYATGNMETYEKFRKELNDIVTDNSTLVDVNTIIKNIEKRGGNVQPGDPLWNVEVQARFRLDTPVKGWKNENFLTGVYKQAEAAGIKDDECKKVLYSLPDKYEFEDEDGDDVEMSPAEYDQFASDCGDLAYKLVSQLSSTSNAKAWSALTIDQQLYAIEKAYDYSKRKFRKDINPDLNITGMGKDLVAVYETAPMDTSKIIAAVMDMAAGYKGEKDRKKK